MSDMELLYQPFASSEVPKLGDTGGNTKTHKFDWYDYGARFYDPTIVRTPHIDPHAENFYSESPYSFLGNNPIANIDPTGMDWYTSKDGSATMWKKGSAEVEGYKNVGATYTLNIGEGVSIGYTQNKATELTVTTNTEWVSQYSKDDWSGTKADKACGKASDAMLGGKTDAGSTTITETVGDGRAGKANGNAVRTISEMKNTIDNGSGVKVGVDFRDGSSEHRDGMGDHFIVANGYIDKLNNGQVTSTTFNYLDPGTKWPSKGAAPTNTLNIKNGRLEGTHINNGLEIIVTSVRRK